jgi:hypothetical protein
MITKETITIILVVLSLTSCQQNRRSIPHEDPSNKAFKTFIQRFKTLQIPLALNSSCFEPDSSISVKLDMDNDSIFIDYKGPAVTIGLFPDTINFYAVIYCTAAACYMPTLAVFSKNGERLSIEQISHGCGTDLGYKCIDSLLIYSMTNIKSKLIEDRYSIDNTGNPIMNTLTRSITIDEFSINKKGLIEKKTNKNSY